jgi:hypothetical protein
MGHVALTGCVSAAHAQCEVEPPLLYTATLPSRPQHLWLHCDEARQPVQQRDDDYSSAAAASSCCCRSDGGGGGGDGGG